MVARRIGVVFALCIIAAITGLSVAFLSTPRNPIIGATATDVAVQPSQTPANNLATEPPAASAVPSVPAATELAPTTIVAAAPSPTGVALATAPAATSLPEPAPTALPATAPATTSQPELAPTAPPPTASAPPPTSAPPTAAATARSADEILQQVKAALANLHSGQLEAAIDYGSGNRASATAQFTLGIQGQPEAIDITTTYEGSSSPQSTQRITIDQRSWQRQADGTWIEQPIEASARHQLETYLPNFNAMAGLEVRREVDLLELHWTGSSAEEMTLVVDPDTNIPLQLRQLAPSSGLVFIVTYKGWNTPVEIKPPV